jgi:hypothetical protein
MAAVALCAATHKRDLLDEMLDVQAMGDFGCDGKLVGQTYDGASVMESHVTGVQTVFLTAYPNALSTHCYSHSIHLIL